MKHNFKHKLHTNKSNYLVETVFIMVTKIKFVEMTVQSICKRLREKNYTILLKTKQMSSK